MIEKIKPLVNTILLSVIAIAVVVGVMYYWKDKPEEARPTPVNNAKIVLPSEIEINVGELGRLDATKSNGVAFIWRCIPDGLNVQVYEDGRKLMFSSGKVGEYICVISSAYNDEVDQKVVTVTVHPLNYDPDNPNPTPPTPTPGPIVPDGTLAGNILVWSQLVKSPGKVVEAAALAQGFDDVAVQIEAGTLVTAEDVQTATRTATNSALGGSIGQWTPFLTKLNAHLKKEKLRGMLVTVEDHIKVWRDIAAGLRNIRS